MLQWLKKIFKNNPVNITNNTSKAGNTPFWVQRIYQKYSNDRLTPEEEIETALLNLESVREFKDEFLTCGIPKKELYEFVNNQIDVLEKHLGGKNGSRKRKKACCV